MWAIAEAAMLGIGGNIEKPDFEKEPYMENIEVEYIDLTDEPDEEGWHNPNRGIVGRDAEEEEEEKQRKKKRQEETEKQEL